MHPLRRSLLFVLAVVMAAWPALAADLETASENAVRAVLLYNFLSFADLPGNGADQKALHICVAARDPELLAAMERLQERRIRGRTLYAQGFGPDIHCDAIYIDSRARWQAMSEGRARPGPSRSVSTRASSTMAASWRWASRRGAPASTSTWPLPGGPASAFTHNCCAWRAACWSDA
jgi:hypothetical protein